LTTGLPASRRMKTREKGETGEKEFKIQ
jgi:hypothetical protein